MAVIVVGVLASGHRGNQARRAVPVSVGTTALHFETSHGEQSSHRLPDNSVLHLNTDSAVTIRFGKTRAPRDAHFRRGRLRSRP